MSAIKRMMSLHHLENQMVSLYITNLTVRLQKTSVLTEKKEHELVSGAAEQDHRERQRSEGESMENFRRNKRAALLETLQRRANKL